MDRSVVLLLTAAFPSVLLAASAGRRTAASPRCQGSAAVVNHDGRSYYAFRRTAWDAAQPDADKHAPSEVISVSSLADDDICSYYTGAVFKFDQYVVTASYFQHRLMTPFEL